jgi:hypothetical protein
VVLGIFVLCFAWLWLINGEFTADLVMAVAGTTVLWGWSYHCVTSAIEVAPAFLAPFLAGLPRWFKVALWIVSLPFGVIDVLSSAIGVASWMHWTGLIGTSQHVQNAVLGEVIAFVPERMIFFLIVVLMRVWL